jgi:hypothetical protein
MIFSFYMGERNRKKGLADVAWAGGRAGKIEPATAIMAESVVKINGQRV